MNQLSHANIDTLINLLEKVKGLRNQLATARSEVVAFVKRVKPARTPENMEQLANVMRLLYGAGAVVGITRAGSLEFSDAGAKAFWFSEVAPHLPKLRQRTGNAAKQDPVAAQAKRLRKQFSAAQLRRLIALLGE